LKSFSGYKTLAFITLVILLPFIGIINIRHDMSGTDGLMLA